MKNGRLIIVMMLLLSTAISFGQLHIDSFYENKDELLIYSVVEDFDSISQEDIGIRVKNWGGTHFVNMKEVLVSETKDQLVFNYITDSFYIRTLGMDSPKSWYIRMVIKIKDNKIKISLYDDGNTFTSGSYGGGISLPSTPARKYRFKDYFNKKGTTQKMYVGGLESIRNSCISTSEDIINSIKYSSDVDSNDDW